MRLALKETFLLWSSCWSLQCTGHCGCYRSRSTCSACCDRPVDSASRYWRYLLNAKRHPSACRFLSKTLRKRSAEFWCARVWTWLRKHSLLANVFVKFCSRNGRLVLPCAVGTEQALVLSLKRSCQKQFEAGICPDSILAQNASHTVTHALVSSEICSGSKLDL